MRIDTGLIALKTTITTIVQTQNTPRKKKLRSLETDVAKLRSRSSRVDFWTAWLNTKSVEMTDTGVVALKKHKSNTEHALLETTRVNPSFSG